MRSQFCALVRDQLGAFVDGELIGADRLEVAQHIQICTACATEVEELTAVGDALRTSLEGLELPTNEFTGLAAGVISRTKAEADESWPGLIRRAWDDGHGFVVAGGSLAATLACFLALSALLVFGPEPERRDSLAGYINHLLAPGVNLASADTRGSRDISLPAPDGADAPADNEHLETQLVEQLAYVVNRRAPLAHTNPTSRLIQEALLDDIVRLRLAEPMLVGRPAAESIDVEFVISTNRPERFFAQ